jgi:signal transduction histidine kinase
MGHPVKRANRKPTFLWQGVLILAPMLVLAQVGALAIWQDKRMAEHEAELRAHDLAEALAEKIAQTWLSVPAKGLINLDSNCNLVQPRPVAVDWSTARPQLSAMQTALLDDARAAEFIVGDQQRAIGLYREFLDTKPSAETTQSARYSLGLLSLATGDRTNAVRAFQEIIGGTDARGDAGADLKALALLRLALLSEATFDEVCRRAVEHPTQLTPQILHAVLNQGAAQAKHSAENWRAIWWNEELQRFLYAQMRPFFRPKTNLLSFASPATPEPPEWIWVNVMNELAFMRGPERPAAFVGDDAQLKSVNSAVGGRLDTSRLLNSYSDGQGGYTVRVYRVPDMVEWTRDAISEFRPPKYFGVSLSVGGRDVIRPEDLPSIVARGGAKGAGRIWAETARGTNAPAVLATAAHSHAGVLPIVARVHLIGPDLFFEQQTARRFWFQLVIAAAAITSTIGFISAYRAFHKQLRLSEMKSNFVSSVSHELRAPIASVRLMAEGLERGKISEPAKQQEYFRFITQECRRLSSMIENVLDFARIEQGRKQYEFEPTDVTALVEQTVKLMVPYAAERGVMLRAEKLQPSTSNLQPTLDGAAIQQALVNLIDNAIKHSPGGAAVLVSLNSQPSTLNLSVRDSGPGIPASEHEKIFERFYRLGSELRRETPGVGIGLSIVKHVVEAHGGRVIVDSEAGQGSCFTIKLPLTAEAQRRREEL